MIPEGPSFLAESSELNLEKILECCKEITIDNKEGDSNLRELWGYLKHFGERRSYPFEAVHNGEGESGINIKTVKIDLYGVTLEIHSSWCALAVVVNLIIPPFNGGGEEQILAYCRSVLLLLAKWANTITEHLEPPHCPPVFTVSFAEKDNLKDPSKCKGNLVAIVSTGKCVNLKNDNAAYKTLNDELVTARFRQLNSSFPSDPARDYPFDPIPQRKQGAPLQISAPYILKQVDDEINNPPKIVPCTKPNCKARGGGGCKDATPNKTKPACFNCILLASAIEAKYGVLWKVVEGMFCPEGSYTPSQQAKRPFDDQDTAESGPDRGKRAKESDP